MPTFREDLHLGHKVPTVDTADIVDGAITEPKLADDSVSTRTIQDGAVTEPKLADGAVSMRTLDNEVKTLLQQGADSSWTPKGNYSELTTYQANDLVYYPETNSSYISLRADNTGHVPPTSEYSDGWWMKVIDGSYEKQAAEIISAAVEEVTTLAGQSVDAIQSLVDNLPVAQVTGQSTTSVMSQKAVTDELGKVNNYIGGDVRTLAVGQTYSTDEAVKTSDGSLARITREVKAMNTTDTVSTGDLKAANSKTYKALYSIAAYSSNGDYSTHPYAVGRPSVYTIIVDTSSMLQGGGISVTLGGTTVEYYVTSEDTAATIAAAIVSGLGTIDGWSIVDNEDGTITVTCLTAGAKTLAFNYTDTGGTDVSVTSESVAGATTTSKYADGAWSAASVANMYGDTSLYEEVPIATLTSTYTMQNSVSKDLIYNITGGEINIPLSITNNLGWGANLTDLSSNYFKRTIVDVIAGDTYILSFRTAGATNKTYWGDADKNIIGSEIAGGQNLRVIAPAGATKLYMSTNTTNTPNTMKVVHIIDPEFVKVRHEGDNVLINDSFSTPSVWQKDTWYPGDQQFSVSNNILTINASTGRKFVQRTLQVGTLYDASKWYRFSFTLRRTTSTYLNRIQIGTCYASTAGTHTEYFDMVMPTTSFKTYSFIGKIYANYGMIKIGAETAFDTIEVSNVLVEQLTDEEYASLDYRNPVGVTYGQSLQKIIDKYPRVQLPAGTIELSYPLTIPNGHTIVGAVGGTTLKLVEGTTCILLSGKTGVTISNIDFLGTTSITAADKSASDIKSRTGEGTKCGITLQTTVNKDIIIENCRFRNFDRAGIYSKNPFNYSYSWFMKVSNCTAYNCWCGIILDERAEYNIISNCSFVYCQYGALVIGGNNKFVNCAFEANGAGFVVNGTTNGSTAANNNSHGIISNSSFNHCISYGVFAADASNGFTFTGCHVYGNTSTASKGGIYISNSRGINFNGGVVGCQIDIDATMSGLNMICNSFFDSGHYNSGTINGNKTKLVLHGNRDYNGTIDKSLLNNDL